MFYKVGSEEKENADVSGMDAETIVSDLQNYKGRSTLFDFLPGIAEKTGR